MRSGASWALLALAVGLAGGWLGHEALAQSDREECLIRKGQPFSIVPAPGGAFDDLIPQEGRR